MWAIYHSEFHKLVATLHHVDDELDTGDIVYQSPIPLDQVAGLHQLRAANTEVLASLSLRALAGFAERGEVSARPQAEHGRYYSFMPAVLKDVCVRRFEEHLRAR